MLALAIAAVATAWSGYQAVRVDGRQSEPFTDPAAPRAPATRRSTAIPSWSGPSG